MNFKNMYKLYQISLKSSKKINNCKMYQESIGLCKKYARMKQQKKYLLL